MGRLICCLTDGGRAVPWLAVFILETGGFLGKSPGTQKLPDGAAGVTDVTGGESSWMRTLGAVPDPRVYLHSSPDPEIGVTFPRVGKFVWSGKKTQVLFIKKLKFSSLSHYFSIPFFHRGCLLSRVLGTVPGAGEPAVDAAGPAPAFRGQLPSPTRWGSPKSAPFKKRAITDVEHSVSFR